MTLEDLVREVDARTEKQLKEAHLRTDAETERIARDAEREASGILDRETEATKRDVERETTRMLASARLQARRIGLDAREKKIEGGQALLFQRLKSYTASAEYFQLLQRMADIGISQLGEDSRLVVRREDAPQLPPYLMVRVIQDRHLSALGGLVVESPDGKRRVSMTLEDILLWKEDRVREILSRQ